jgi:hypothetical protein
MGDLGEDQKEWEVEPLESPVELPAPVEPAPREPVPA